MLLRPVTVQGSKIGNDYRPIPATDNNLRGQGHRIEKAVSRCAIATRVVGGWSGNDESSMEATVDQVEGRLHRQAGSRYRRVEGAGRNGTILRIQPSAAPRRSFPDSFDVCGIMYPSKRANRVFVHRQRAFTIHHPTPFGPRRQSVEHHSDPFRRLGMTEPRLVLQTPRVRSHAQWHFSDQIGHGAMIAKE